MQKRPRDVGTEHCSTPDFFSGRGMVRTQIESHLRPTVDQSPGGCDAATKAIVSRWVKFYKEYRGILDSHLIHLRRADGRDWDGWLHVNPRLPERGVAVFYNPLDEPIERHLKLPLYYTGLTDRAVARWENGKREKLKIARDYSTEVLVRIGDVLSFL